MLTWLPRQTMGTSVFTSPDKVWARRSEEGIMERSKGKETASPQQRAHCVWWANTAAVSVLRNAGGIAWYRSRTMAPSLLANSAESHGWVALPGHSRVGLVSVRNWGDALRGMLQR